MTVLKSLLRWRSLFIAQKLHHLSEGPVTYKRIHFCSQQNKQIRIEAHFYYHHDPGTNIPLCFFLRINGQALEGDTETDRWTDNWYIPLSLAAPFLLLFTAVDKRCLHKAQCVAPLQSTLSIDRYRLGDPLFKNLLYTRYGEMPQRAIQELVNPFVMGSPSSQQLLSRTCTISWCNCCAKELVQHFTMWKIDLNFFIA